MTEYPLYGLVVSPPGPSVRLGARVRSIPHEPGKAAGRPARSSTPPGNVRQTTIVATHPHIAAIPGTSASESRRKSGAV
jgi:hypothetical protein